MIRWQAEHRSSNWRVAAPSQTVLKSEPEVSERAWDYNPDNMSATNTLAEIVE
jgi:hypothetical protein